MDEWLDVAVAPGAVDRTGWQMIPTTGRKALPVAGWLDGGER
jgi:hypothetical protein